MAFSLCVYVCLCVCVCVSADSTVYLFRVNAPLALLCIVFLSGTFVYKIITWFAE